MLFFENRLINPVVSDHLSRRKQAPCWITRFCAIPITHLRRIVAVRLLLFVRSSFADRLFGVGRHDRAAYSRSITSPAAMEPIRVVITRPYRTGSSQVNSLASRAHVQMQVIGPVKWVRSLNQPRVSHGRRR